MNRNMIIIALLLVSMALVVVAVTASNDPIEPVNGGNGEEGDSEEELIDDTDDEKNNGQVDNGGNDNPSGITDMDELVSCLKTAGVVIYGTVTCPFCVRLVEDFGGYEVIGPIYVECTEYSDRCNEEMIGRGVPEIQIKGEMYQGSRVPADIGRAVGCHFSG